MKSKTCKRPDKIKQRTALISMLTLGVLAIIYAVRGFLFDLTPSTYGFVGLAIAFILFVEIGFKKISKLSTLKALGNQQKISLGIAVTVLITAIGLLFGYEIPVLSNIASGSYLTGGVFVILEAFTD